MYSPRGLINNILLKNISNVLPGSRKRVDDSYLETPPPTIVHLKLRSRSSHDDAWLPSLVLRQSQLVITTNFSENDQTKSSSFARKDIFYFEGRRNAEFSGYIMLRS